MGQNKHKRKRKLVIGAVNRDGQHLLQDLNRTSATHPSAKVCRLRCLFCGHNYGANGCDIHIRKCPACQQGMPGEDVGNTPS